MISERINGICIEGPDSARGVIAEVFEEDAYHIAQMVTEGSSILDLGAHIGCFTLRCAIERRCSQVTAVEPNPISFGWLAHNVRTGRASNVRTINGAVSAISGTSRSAPRPAAIAVSIAFRYTSVLPEPVTPCSRNAWNWRETMQSCICVNAAC